jgi:hypothetical protein
MNYDDTKEFHYYHCHKIFLTPVTILMFVKNGRISIIHSHGGGKIVIIQNNT